MKIEGVSTKVIRQGLTVESELRSWLKANKKVWRIENKTGGDFGMPDTFMMLGEKAAFIELKIAFVSAKKEWVIVATPKQIEHVRNLQAEGCMAFFLCGHRFFRTFGICFNTNHLQMIAKANLRPGQRRQYIVSKWDFQGHLEDFQGLERWVN